MNVTAFGRERMDPEPPSSRLQGAVKEYATRGIRLYLLLFVIEVGAFFVIASLPFLPGEKAFFTSQSNQINNEFQGVGFLGQFWGIFTNNFRIAAIELIPGLGAVFFAISLYETARIIEAIAGTDQASPVLVLVLLLLLFPHSYLELPAYAVATGEGLVLAYAIARWLLATGPSPVSLKVEFWQLALNVVVVAAMLLVAAVFESAEIQLGAMWFWVTWLPFVGLVALAISLYRKLNKIRNETRAELSSEAKKDDSSHLSV